MQSMTKGRLALMLGASALALATAAPAHAQSVNYGELEEIFGEPVTTAATGKPQKVSEVPVNMEIVTQDDIRRSGADNIVDVLNFVTGVDVRRSGFGDASVSIRGSNQPQSGRLLVLLNGRQVYRDDYGSVTWATIPVELDEIRQIEVVKGPSSALFGFNAVGGVVNIVTYDPLQDKVNIITGRAGTQNLAEGSAVTTVHAYDTFGVRVSAGGYLADEFAPGSGQSAVGTIEPKRGSISADSKARVAPGVEVGLYGAGSSVQNLALSPYGTFGTNYYRTNAFRTYVLADTPVGTVDVNLYRNELKFRSISTSVAWTNDVYVLQASDLVKLGTDHTVRVGLEYRNNSADSSYAPNAGGFGGTFGYQVYSGSAMWDWQISPVLELTNAVRVDYLALNKSGTAVTTAGYTIADFSNRSLTAFAYNSGLVWKVTDMDTVRVTAARGIQAPSLLMFGYNSGGNPQINPAIVTNYELGYDRSFPSIGSTIRTSVFYQNTDDVLTAYAGAPVTRTPNGNLTAVATNIGSSHSIGWEIGIKGHSASGFRWNASYALTSVTDDLRVNQGPVPTSVIDYQHGTPTNNIILGAGYSIDKWEFDVIAKWQSSFRDYAPITGVPGAALKPVLIANYLSANARIGYRVLENVTLAFTAEQFTQSRIVETAGGRPVERRFIASASARF